MPALSNRGVKWGVAVLLFIYAAIYLIGRMQGHSLPYLCLLNAVSSLLAIVFFVWDKLRPLQRMPESREIIFLLVEGLFAAGALWALTISPVNAWLAGMQYLIFTLHSIVLLLLLIFVCTFRIKKLF